MDYKSKAVTNKAINIPKTAVYKFRFANSAVGGRVCKYKIQRIPASETTKNFNTSVYWANKQDTSFYDVQERYLVRRDYVPKTVIETTDFYINSGRNALLLGGKSRITFPVSLPENTVEWYYQFSASRDEEEVKRTKGLFNLAGKLSKAIDQTGSLSFGINQITQPPGADYCDVYLFDHLNSQLFEAKTNYKYFTTGTRENIKSGVVKVNHGLGGIPYIGIKNPDSGFGVHVLLECVAIVLEEEWGLRSVTKFKVSSKKEPYLQPL